MNRDKFLKILTFTMMLGIFSSTLNNVKADSCESIINELYKIRKELHPKLRNDQDIVLCVSDTYDKKHYYDIVTFIRRSNEYDEFMKEYGKDIEEDENIEEDNVVFVLMLLYIKSSDKIERKEIILERLISMRTKKERLVDEVIFEMCKDLCEMPFGGDERNCCELLEQYEKASDCKKVEGLFPCYGV